MVMIYALLFVHDCHELMMYDSLGPINGIEQEKTKDNPGRIEEVTHQFCCILGVDGWCMCFHTSFFLGLCMINDNETIARLEFSSFSS